MKYEAAACWPLPINDGNEFAFVAKMQTSVIKAIYRMCPVSLTIARADTADGVVLATTLKIYDDPDAPLMLSGVLRHEEEQLAIENILRSGRTLMIFCDELSRPVARASCTLVSSDSFKAIEMIVAPGKRYTGPWTPLLSDVLDELQGLEDPQLAVASKFAPSLVKVKLTLSDFETNKLSAIGVDDVIDFKLDDPDEGRGLEQSTWQLLESLFADQLFHSPQVREGSNLRELTDIFAFCDVGQCLFEAKAAAMLTTNPDRTTQRRANSVQKQIDKGIYQLVGAMKNLDAGLPLLTKKGEPLTDSLTPDSYRHGIVMVSEMLPSLDWEGIGARLLATSDKSGALLHVLDLRELRVLVGISREKPKMFVAYLTYRFGVMKEHKHALLRMQPKGPPIP